MWSLIIYRDKVDLFSWWRHGSKRKQKHSRTSWGVGLKVLYHYSCHILPAETRQKATPGWEIASTFWWKELQSHRAKGTDTGKDGELQPSKQSSYHNLPCGRPDIKCVCVCLIQKSCMTLCDPMDCSPTGSSGHGMFQARILRWVAISFSRGSSRPKDQTWASCIGRRIPCGLNH